ncbi:hypothetical protein WJX72_005127 [[Myrmecia] bisecta]|uniref:Uncharacterized protein n=1 Tax=[Myrmecia] bisecta TaxID=41462 RepID=A0AAW1PBK9_9CHLO
MLISGRRMTAEQQQGQSDAAEPVQAEADVAPRDTRHAEPLQPYAPWLDASPSVVQQHSWLAPEDSLLGQPCINYQGHASGRDVQRLQKIVSQLVELVADDASFGGTGSSASSPTARMTKATAKAVGLLPSKAGASPTKAHVAVEDSAEVIAAADEQVARITQQKGAASSADPGLIKAGHGSARSTLHMRIRDMATAAFAELAQQCSRQDKAHAVLQLWGSLAEVLDRAAFRSDVSSQDAEHKAEEMAAEAAKAKEKCVKLEQQLEQAKSEQEKLRQQVSELQASAAQQAEKALQAQQAQRAELDQAQRDKRALEEKEPEPPRRVSMLRAKSVAGLSSTGSIADSLASADFHSVSSQRHASSEVESEDQLLDAESGLESDSGSDLGSRDEDGSASDAESDIQEEGAARTASDSESEEALDHSVQDDDEDVVSVLSEESSSSDVHPLDHDSDAERQIARRPCIGNISSPKTLSASTSHSDLHSAELRAAEAKPKDGQAPHHASPLSEAQRQSLIEPLDPLPDRLRESSVKPTFSPQRFDIPDPDTNLDTRGEITLFNGVVHSVRSMHAEVKHELQAHRKGRLSEAQQTKQQIQELEGTVAILREHLSRAQELLRSQVVMTIAVATIAAASPDDMWVRKLAQAARHSRATIKGGQHYYANGSLGKPPKADRGAEEAEKVEAEVAAVVQHSLARLDKAVETGWMGPPETNLHRNFVRAVLTAVESAACLPGSAYFCCTFTAGMEGAVIETMAKLCHDNALASAEDAGPVTPEMRAQALEHVRSRMAEPGAPLPAC